MLIMHIPRDRANNCPTMLFQKSRLDSSYFKIVKISTAANASNVNEFYLLYYLCIKYFYKNICNVV